MQGKRDWPADSKYGKTVCASKPDGAVDELNASVGVVRVINADMKEESIAAQQLEDELRWVQNKLFDVGSILPQRRDETFKNMPRVAAQDVLRLEK